jgi:hypothetical protein
MFSLNGRAMRETEKSKVLDLCKLCLEAVQTIETLSIINCIFILNSRYFLLKYENLIFDHHFLENADLIFFSFFKVSAFTWVYPQGGLKRRNLYELVPEVKYGFRSLCTTVLIIAETPQLLPSPRIWAHESYTRALYIGQPR